MYNHKVLVGHLDLGVEQEVGAFTTVLSSDINASTTSITLNDASQFPALEQTLFK